jgi:hypothetical protein
MELCFGCSTPSMAVTHLIAKKSFCSHAIVCVLLDTRKGAVL